MNEGKTLLCFCFRHHARFPIFFGAVFLTSMYWVIYMNTKTDQDASVHKEQYFDQDNADSPTASLSMMQGASPDSLHTISVAMMSDAQHSLPIAEQPSPPHRPHSVGQHVPAASYPARPLEHVWAAVYYFEGKQADRRQKRKR